ncbi:MAG: glycosyltransferase family 4 protein, partial [Chloroflexi bacterium]|nr:glycosyltransferase family 4 protein [Chloroflexota bacterium]
LALMFKLARCNKPHVMVNHYLTPAKKSVFVKRLGVASHIDRFICYGSTQVSFLTETLGIPAEKVELALHPADSRFWHPMPVERENLIFSPGNTARDNETFLKAVDSLDVDVVLTGFSPWVSGKQQHSEQRIPERVKYTRCTIEQVRDYYARSRFVVVPLMPVNFQAGTLATYEAMAMGRAVITTHNGGNIDVVRDGETGIYVPSQDAEALRRAIVRLLENPEEAERMGMRGRELVEQGLNLDGYARRVAQIVRDTWEQSRQSANRLSAVAASRNTES